MNIKFEFLNIEFLWLLVLIPISILWHLYANHYKSNSLNFSNSAAFSESKKILFVNRGVDVTRPLSAQNDCFWWGYQDFSLIDKPYNSFQRIVRGYQSKHKDDFKNSKSQIICTLFKQPLSNMKVLGGIFSENGDILDIFESN